MNILILLGSARKEGACARMARALLSRLPQGEGTSVNIVNMYENTPQPCVGCGACSKRDVCRFDDMDGLWRQIEQSDVLIIASPVYLRGLPAPMKALIDRMQRPYMAKKRGEALKGVQERRVVVLLASGTRCEDGSVVEAELKYVLPLLSEKPYIMVQAKGTDYSDELSEETLCELDKLAQLIAD